MNTTRVGRRAEYRTEEWFAAQGYYVMRASASRGLADIIAVRPGEALMVEVKSRSARLRGAHRARLIALVKRLGPPWGALCVRWPRYAREPVVTRLVGLLLALCLSSAQASRADVEWIFGGPSGAAPIGQILSIAATDDNHIAYATNRGVWVMDVRSGTRMTIYRPETPANQTGLRVVGSALYWIDGRRRVIMRYDGTRASDVLDISRACFEPFDIARLPGGWVVACYSGHALVRVSDAGDVQVIDRVASQYCQPVRGGIFGPRSVDISPSGDIVSAWQACGTVVSYAQDGTPVLIAGIPWQRQIGLITPHQTLAMQVALGAASVRIARDAMYIGSSAGGVLRVELGRITHVWRAPDGTAQDELFGLGLALSDSYVWASGQRSLVRIALPYRAPTPHPSPTYTRTSTSTVRPSATATLSPTGTARPATVTPTQGGQKSLCDALRAVVAEYCEGGSD